MCNIRLILWHIEIAKEATVVTAYGKNAISFRVDSVELLNCWCFCLLISKMGKLIVNLTMQIE